MWSIDKLLSNISGTVVTVQPVVAENAISYADARSAAFYSLGRAIKECGMVILVVPGHFLASVYTAITEAWFQKANVVVLALFEKISEVKTSWMDRCVLQYATYGEDEWETFLHELDRVRGIPGPVLFNLVGLPVQEEPIDYSDALAALYAVKEDAVVWAYNPKKNLNASITAIEEKDKYGVLSRYIGMSAVKDVGILLCPARCALVDMNIFRTRYANGQMKIILQDENGILADLDVDRWIQSNGWACMRVERVDAESCNWLMEQQQSVLIINREG